MTIMTRDFGELEIDEKNILTFPNGLFAFEESHTFALLSPLGEDTYPMWLQATDSVTPCFIVFDPRLIDNSYEITLNSSEKKLLKLEDESKASCLAIAVVPDDFRNTTVNMKSPIIINTEEKLAAQVILPQNYPFRLPIYKQEGEE